MPVSMLLEHKKLAQPRVNELVKTHSFLSIKEVIQPHLPVGLPCYDLVPVISLTFGVSFLAVR